jgi:malate/lactate dehydrogenase
MRVVIAGAGGGVGASAAFNLLLSPLDCDLVLLDSRHEMVVSHAMDYQQVLEQGATGTVREGDGSDLADADVLVVAASAPLTVNTSRMVYLEANAAILAALLGGLPATWDGVLLIVTNPVDPLCTWAVRMTGLPRRRVLGYTLNDSLRLRTAVGRALGVRAGRVRAWTVGEHGDLAVPLLDRISLDGEPMRLSSEQRVQVRDFIDGWYVRHVALDSGRSSTWTSGLGVARMVAACCGDGDGGLWPCSVMLDGEYGVSGVSLSVPVALGAGGVQRIHEWELSEAELDRLRAGAEFVRAAASQLPAFESAERDLDQ